MERRAFVIGVGSGLLAAPLAAEAQQPGKVFRIGFLSAFSASADSPHSEAFRQGLRDLGYVEGQTSSSQVARSIRSDGSHRGLVASGQIKSRRIDGWRRIVAVLSRHSSDLRLSHQPRRCL